MMILHVPIVREPDAHDLPLPAYATAGAAGMDLYAALTETLIMAPGERALVSVGIRLALPSGYEAQVRPRSGLALRHGLGMVNAPGTIDSDYRGVVHVILINWGQETVALQRGDRIAQLVVAPITQVVWQEADTPLPATVRQDGGFGHTGHGYPKEGESHVASQNS